MKVAARGGNKKIITNDQGEKGSKKLLNCFLKEVYCLQRMGIVMNNFPFP